MAPRVVILDKLEDQALEELRALRVDVAYNPDVKEAALAAAIQDAHILIVRSRRVTSQTILGAHELALIVRAGSGVDTIDVDCASGRGIYVANCPGRNSVAVAELTLGLILALDRRIADNVAALRAGKWDKAGYSQARGIKGRRLGLVGLGSIGREVAKRARALEMHVTAFSPSLTPERASQHHVDHAGSMQKIFQECDVVSLHLPESDATRGLIGAELLELMQPGAILINTSRAGIIDRDALLLAVRSRRIWLGADVFAEEPAIKTGDFQDPLGQEPNVYGTHHIGASTTQAQSAIAARAVEIVRTFVTTGEVLDAVNVSWSPPTKGTIVVRHLDRVGVLANVLSILKAAAINVETMENVIFTGGIAASARIRLAQEPGPAVLSHLRAIEHVLNVELLS